MTIERELKVLAEAGTALPDLSGAAEGLVVGEAARFDLRAVYYDTADLSMMRSGVTLRSRTGEPGPAWTLKLPTGSQDGGLSRHEINFDGDLAVVPAAALDAVTAYVRRSKLQPVAEILTTRTATNLLRGDVTVATMCDDHVEGKVKGRLKGTGVPQFREIEVELISPIPDVDVLKAVRARFRDAGWKVDESPLPKLNRVLGDAINTHPIVPLSTVGHKTTLPVAVQAVLAKSVYELITFDPGTRLDLDVEDLHRFRVAARRMRSDLRTFRSVLGTTWVNNLRTELRWLGERAGSVRDLDVFAERLEVAVQTLDESDASATELLMSHLREQRAAARSELLAALTSPRYLDLLDSVVQAASAPQFANAARDDNHPDRRRAKQLASDVLPTLVHKSWKQLNRAAADLRADSPDEDFHEVRILAKRCRYATEAALPVCGRPARRFASGLKELQTVLGDLQDTVVVESWLRTVPLTDPTVGIVVGLLIAAERDQRLAARENFEHVWKKASQESLRDWMKN